MTLGCLGCTKPSGGCGACPHSANLSRLGFTLPDSGLNVNDWKSWALAAALAFLLYKLLFTPEKRKLRLKRRHAMAEARSKYDQRVRQIQESY